LGFGWVPVSLVEEELRTGALVEVPYEGGARYSFVPVLVHPKEKPLGRAGRLFLKRLEAAWR
jgi:DNA-binding transcriptional LysR family regulator